MRKIFAFLIGLFFYSFTYCQDIYKITRSSYEKYEYGEWVEKRVNYPENMFVIINGKSIKFTNDANLSLMTYGDYNQSTFENHITYTWDAYDNEGVRCVFMMKVPRFDKSNIVLVVLYNKQCLNYYVTLEK